MPDPGPTLRPHSISRNVDGRTLLRNDHRRLRNPHGRVFPESRQLRLLCPTTCRHCQPSEQENSFHARDRVFLLSARKPYLRIFRPSYLRTFAPPRNFSASTTRPSPRRNASPARSALALVNNRTSRTARARSFSFDGTTLTIRLS